jgi:hypothetical protein
MVHELMSIYIFARQSHKKGTGLGLPGVNNHLANRLGSFYSVSG